MAFFPAEHFASESAAARACIAAAGAIRAALPTQQSARGSSPTMSSHGSGCTWGATLFMGAITTAARTEVTALGDEANEAARSEACASGGRALASEQRLERLEPADAGALDIDLDRLAYTRLADLDTTTDEARRDAPAIAVSDV